MHKWI